MSIERRAFKGMIAGAFVFVINTTQTFVVVPILLGRWGAERYGAWLILQSLLTLMTTLDAGHQQYVAGEIAKVYFGRRELLRTVLASAMWTATASGCLELLIVGGLWAGGWMARVTGLDPALVARDHIPLALFLLALSAVLVNAIGGMAARLLPPAGHYVRFTMWSLTFRSGQALMVAVAALLGCNIVVAAALSALTAVVVLVGLARDLRKLFPELWPIHDRASASLGARHYSESLVLTGSGALLQLQQNGVNLLVISALGASALTLFATVRTVTSAFYLAPNVLAGPLAPDMTRFHVSGEHAKLRATIAAHWFVAGSTIQLGMIVLLPVLRPLYETWIHHALVFDRLLCALLAFAIALRTFGSPLLNYIVSINQLRAMTVTNAVQSICALGVTAIALRRFGVAGAGFGTVAGDFAGSCIAQLIFVVGELPRDQRSPFLRDATLASLPVGVTGVFLGMYGLGWPLFPVCTLGVVVLLPLFAIQWRSLAPEVRLRVQGVLTRFIRRLPGANRLAF